jgi:P-type Ca2+ transporter type 2C
MPELPSTDVAGQIQRVGEDGAFVALETRPGGLSSDEAVARAAQYGPNRLPELPRRSVLWRFIAQFRDFFAVLLEVAGGITFASYLIGGNSTNLKVAIAIFAVVILNAAIGFSMEYRAERTAEALRQLLPAHARVMRDGGPTELPAEALVPGDVVLLEEGDAISADCRIVAAAELATSDAALTGESEPVRRQSAPVLEDLPRLQARNLAFAGTSVASGRGRGVVYATGADTEFGHIFRLAGAVEDELSPLQREVAVAARRVAIVALALGALLLGLRLLAGAPIADAFLYALGVMVALVPEGLPAVLSVSLAVGVQRMAAARALIKRLSSVEALGSTTVICTDKTGTLTAGEMTAVAVWCLGRSFGVSGAGYAPVGQLERADGPVVSGAMPDSLRQLVRSAMLCNNARLVTDEATGAGARRRLAPAHERGRV